MKHLLLDTAQLQNQRWLPALARWLLLGHYLLFGLLAGMQSVVWEDIKRTLALGEGPFGTIMLVTPLVGFGLLLFGGPLWKRWSRQQVSVLGLVAVVLAIIALANARDLYIFLLARVLSGLGFALLESGANNAALDWEQATGRQIVSVMYACFSGGIVGGALLAGALLRMGWNHHEALMALAPLWLVMSVVTALVVYPPRRWDAVQSTSILPTALLRKRSFVVLAALCLVGVSGEALADMWLVIYLRGLGADALVGSIAFALFSGAMIIGRLGNAAIIKRWGMPVALRWACAGVAASAALLMLGGVVASAAAFVVLGLGVASVLPIVLSATRQQLPDESDAAAGGIVAMSYLPFVVLPPTSGWIAEGIGMHFALPLVLSIIAVALYGLSREVE